MRVDSHPGDTNVSAPSVMGPSRINSDPVALRHLL